VATELTKRANGRVQVEIYHGGTLGKVTEMIDLIGGGAVDLGNCGHGYSFARLPMNAFFNAPMIYKNHEMAAKMSKLGYQTQKKIQEDMKKNNLHPFLFGALTQYRLISKKPIRTLADFKGLKIRTFGAVNPKMFIKLGAVPVNLSFTEAYGALQKGTLDCVYLTWTGSYILKLFEVAKYVIEYLFTEIFSHQQPEIGQYLLATSILDRFCGPLCEAVCVQGTEQLTCEISGLDFIAWLKKENLFLIPLDDENQWFRFHHLFQKLLRNQLNHRLSQEDINALHAQASAWLAEKGLIEEATRHALAGGNSAAAARLIVQHCFELVSSEQWPTLKRWLNLLEDDVTYQDLELVILLAWTHVPFFRIAEMISCLNKTEALLSARTTAEHLQGHIDALRVELCPQHVCPCPRLSGPGSDE
jgi:hypothetical protein